MLAQLAARVEGEQDVLALGFAKETALTLLSAIAGGMIAFTGLVISVSLLVVQFGAGQYTPRLVGLFRRDRVVTHALGIFIAPAICAIVSMGFIGEYDADVVPSLLISLNVVLLVAAVLAFFLLVSRLLDLLRPRVLVAHLVELGTQAAREVYPFELGRAPHLPLPFEEAAEKRSVRHSGPPGRAGGSGPGCVRADRLGRRRGGGAHARHRRLCPDRCRAVRRPRRDGGGVRRRAAARGDHVRGADHPQDPAFAIRAIVDIALRALSPAVNDPTTGVNAIDGLESLLLFLAHRDVERGRITDEAGTVRLVYPAPSWPSLLDLALTEIRHYGVDSPQIARKLRSTLLALRRDSPELRWAEIDDQLARLDASVRAAYADERDRAEAEVPDSLGLGAPGT